MLHQVQRRIRAAVVQAECPGNKGMPEGKQEKAGTRAALQKSGVAFEYSSLIPLAQENLINQIILKTNFLQALKLPP